jgi:N-acetylglutamate synthase
MTVSVDELAHPRVPGLEINRVQDKGGLAKAAAVSAATGGAPLEWMLALFTPELLRLSGFAVYLGRVEGEEVTVAMAYRTGSEVGIFNVGTPPEHRRRGYGAAVTAHAVRSAFEEGADLGWLQTTKIGESVYRALGFRHVVKHFMLVRPTTQNS